MKTLILILCLGAAATAAAAEPPRNVDPDATPGARALLDLLYEIQGTHTLSGQHNFIATGNMFTDKLREATGRTPMVWGSDFSFAYEGEAPERFQHCGPLNLTTPGTDVDFMYRGDWQQPHHDDLRKLAAGKPIAIGEMAPPPTPRILDAQPHWAWFMPWGNLVFWGRGPQQMKTLMEDERVLSLEDVTRGGDGRYRITR